MTEQKITIGMDRFIAKRWADYALDLRSSSEQEQNRYIKLREWLGEEIRGREVVEKTASQLKRLWLAEDQYSFLRNHGIEIGMAQDPSSRSILHYGLAINVFPFFRDLCITVGRLIQLQGRCIGKDVQQRLLERYQSRATIAHAARRGLLTLLDWGILIEENGFFTNRQFQLVVPDHSVWFIHSLLQNYPRRCATLTDLITFPENLGIIIADLRSVVRETNSLLIERNGRNEEVVIYRERF